MLEIQELLLQVGRGPKQCAVQAFPTYGPVYNVVGVVKNFFPVGQTNFELRESGAGSRAAPRSGTFIEDP
jgi:hypothetical protein